MIYAAGTGAKEFDRESLRTLREIPMDQVEWSVTNSHRLDIPFDPLADRFKRRQALIVLPYDELPMSKWNGNPYNLDGGNGGRSEDDGAHISCCRIGWDGFTGCLKRLGRRFAGSGARGIGSRWYSRHLC